VGSHASLGVLARVSDGGAGPSVLAVPSVPVEEDEVRFTRVVDHLIDSNEPLDRRPTAALVERIEIHDANHLSLWRRLRLEWPATYAAISRVAASLGLR
jgi:hypothetical protein